MAKPNRAEIFQALAQVVSGNYEDLKLILKTDTALNTFRPTSGERYYVGYRKNAAPELLVDTGNKVLAFASFDNLVNDILNYSTWISAQYTKEEFSLTANQAAEVAKVFIACGGRGKPYEKGPRIITAERYESLPVVRQIDDDDFCFHRLPVGAVYDPHKCPLWNSIIERMSNASAFLQFLWSLIEPDSYVQQYVWLYGGGGSGKSTISRLIEYLLGPAYVSVNVPKQDKFWSAQLLGKRLAVFNECSNPAYPKSAEFKSYSGGDPVKIEYKGKNAFTAKLNCKFMFISNDEPMIDTTPENLRRAIICNLEPTEHTERNVDPKFFQKLLKELPYILGMARAEYQAVCPDHAPIPNVVPDFVGANEDEDYRTFLKYVEIHDDDPAIVNRDKEFITCDEMAEIRNDLCQYSKTKRGQLNRWLKRKHVHCKTIKLGNGVVEKRWINVSRRPQNVSNIFGGNRGKYEYD